MVVVWYTPGFCPPFANLQTCANANIGLTLVSPSGVNLIAEGLASLKPRSGAARIARVLYHVLTVNGEPKPTDLISVRLKDFNRHFSRMSYSEECYCVIYTSIRKKKNGKEGI